jgi:hypothetical protein
MASRDAYLFYEAGQAVAAAHLGLKIRVISGNPASGATDIPIPKKDPKARMILWLTGMAAEKKAVGKSDPLRRTRNRARMRSQIETAMAALTGTRDERFTEARSLLNQAQDRANAICSALYPAIEQVVAKLRLADALSGEEVVEIVRTFKQKRAAAGQPTIDEAAAPVHTIPADPAEAAIAATSTPTAMIPEAAAPAPSADPPQPHKGPVPM